MINFKEPLDALVQINDLRGNLPALEKALPELLEAPDKTKSRMALDAAILALGEICRSKQEVNPGIEQLALSDDPRRRAMFCHVIGYAGDNGLDYSGHIMRLAKDESPEVRLRAIQCIQRLRELGMQDTERILDEATRDPDPKVRARAMADHSF